MNKCGRKLVLLALCLAAASPPIASEECPGGYDNWIHLGRSYYVIQRSTRYSHSAAKQKCSELGATLANIKTAETFYAVRSRLEEINVDSVWIGLSRSSRNSDSSDVSTRREDWKWSDGDTINPLARFTAWGSQHPEKNQRCAVMKKPSSSYYYAWYGSSCDSGRHNFICERESCEAFYDFSQYQFQTDGNDRLTPISGIAVLALATLIGYSIQYGIDI